MRIPRLPRDITVSPLPFADPGDADATRTWVIEWVERALATQSTMPAEAFFFTTQALVRVPIDVYLWPGLESAVAGLFLGAAARPGVVRSFRASMIRVAGPGWQRGVAVMDAAPPTPDRPGRWWVAERDIAPGNAVPVKWAGPWKTWHGSDPGALGLSLRRWIDPSAPPPEGPWPDPGRPWLNQVVQGRPEVPVPPDPRLLARVLEYDVTQEALAVDPDDLWVFVMRPGQTERWTIRRGVPENVHEVIRNVVVYAPEPVEGVVLVHQGLLELEGQLHRAFYFVAEVGGRRAARAVPVRRAADGRLEKGQAVDIPGGIAGPRAWIGIPPKKKLDLLPVGPEPAEA